MNHRDEDLEKYEVHVYVDRTSDSGKAIYCCAADDEEMADMFWLPLSQIEILDTNDKIWTIELPQWLAEEKGVQP